MGQKVWVISVNMGYGHQRTSEPLRDLAFAGEVINANDYSGIPKKDKALWEGTRTFYEFISRFKRIPFIGNLVFSIFDYFQKILTFYPKRDLSEPNFTLKNIYSSIKKGWGRDLIEKLAAYPPPFSEKGRGGAGLKRNLPLISTFFIPAFMVEFFKYPGEIFCIVCDADIARTWAALNPKESKIKYFAPTERVVERLKLYGVKEENIFLTGYPLPMENIGSEKMEILKEDLRRRILNLDPQKKYFEKYKILIEENLGKLPEKSKHPLTILFSVGGSGVQKEIGIKVVKSLAVEIWAGEVKVILSAGVRQKVKEYFGKNIRNLGLEEKLNKNIEILSAENIEDYFQKFNQALRKTDILWTKPSELSFYSALGTPIIIAPPIGSQEEFNKRWLLKSGFGVSQENPRYTRQWLFDWLNQGYLAEAAMEGFIEGEKLGVLKIKEIISK
ncbi:MAG: hypothetical protein COT33_01350 [Candidatus Nealsonbacteria bacterium CG08_land_8_20_14_0_20_38_20]|uniref:Glycosyl transferase family 28 C-terminal domain-containing protein n=1 Tax=Candidatus Nealsonbacteria bacterium CG08_land_8_20_14_0_20_38_20 TaxID=1974705 RepID=A0A2H0YM64_9BACT|nr:MAG: hypothetical protein COT33_01350 [Candidatus Nealsonbacteria bacterium CG08_land_8_20_14_0_20_38_20]